MLVFSSAQQEDAQAGQLQPDWVSPVKLLLQVKNRITVSFQLINWVTLDFHFLEVLTQDHHSELRCKSHCRYAERLT